MMCLQILLKSEFLYQIFIIDFLFLFFKYWVFVMNCASRRTISASVEIGFWLNSSFDQHMNFVVFRKVKFFSCFCNTKISLMENELLWLFFWFVGWVGLNVFWMRCGLGFARIKIKEIFGLWNVWWSIFWIFFIFFQELFWCLNMMNVFPNDFSFSFILIKWLIFFKLYFWDIKSFYTNGRCGNENIICGFSRIFQKHFQFPQFSSSFPIFYLRFIFYKPPHLPTKILSSIKKTRNIFSKLIKDLKHKFSIKKIILIENKFLFSGS